MQYLLWALIVCFVLNVIFMGFSARSALAKMQKTINGERGESIKIYILNSLDANRVILEYKKLYPHGRILRHYRILMAVFFISGALAALLFMVQISFVTPVNYKLDRPYVRSNNEVSH